MSYDDNDARGTLKSNSSILSQSSVLDVCASHNILQPRLVSLFKSVASIRGVATIFKWLANNYPSTQATKRLTIHAWNPQSQCQRPLHRLTSKDPNKRWSVQFLDLFLEISNNTESQNKNSELFPWDCVCTFRLMPNLDLYSNGWFDFRKLLGHAHRRVVDALNQVMQRRTRFSACSVSITVHYFMGKGTGVHSNPAQQSLRTEALRSFYFLMGVVSFESLLTSGFIERWRRTRFESIFKCIQVEPRWRWS